ncbi:Sodium-dependent dicarboxylate transporter SdcS [Lentibacillus sp. JNUCC-1]|nr:Sodium-dependent dicarboxylate transporter SdcS [Lentibacillus sp. JNUCC-1]
MLSAAWNWFWEKDAQAKDLVRFFVKPNSTRTSSTNTGSNSSSGNNGGGKHRYYKTGQLIGLFLGPILFILTLLFFHPENLSGSGQAILASTMWIAVWWITVLMSGKAHSFRCGMRANILRHDLKNKRFKIIKIKLEHMFLI